MRCFHEVSTSFTSFVSLFFLSKNNLIISSNICEIGFFFRQNSRDENERILMTKPGLSHNVSLLSNCWRRQVKKDLFDKQKRILEKMSIS